MIASSVYSYRHDCCKVCFFFERNSRVYEYVFIELSGLCFNGIVLLEIFLFKGSSSFVYRVLLILTHEEVITHFRTDIIEFWNTKLLFPKALSIFNCWYLYNFPFLSVSLFNLTGKVVFSPSLHNKYDSSVLVLSA